MCGTEDERGSDLSGVNPPLVAGEPEFGPTTNASAWELPLNRISIGNESLPVNGTATLDSELQGTDL